MRSALMVIVLLSVSLVAQGQSRTNARSATEQVNGEYVGIESDESLSPDQPEIKWFHENALIVRNNEAILDRIPFTVERGKKFYSASDGGFTTDRGRFFEKGGQTFLYLRLFESDYIVFPMGGCEPYSRIRVVPVTFLPNGIKIEGVVYKHKALSSDTRRRLLAMLKKEPMEYTGEHPHNKNAPVCDNSGVLAAGAERKRTVTGLPRFMTDIPQPIPDELRLSDAPRTVRNVDCYHSFTDSNSMVDVVRKCGIPDEHQGSGIYIFIYDMDDGSMVAVGTPDLKRLFYVDHLVGKTSKPLLQKSSNNGSAR